MHKVVKLMEGVATQAGVSLQIRLARSATEAAQTCIMADARRLRQMLMILLDNAICYSSRGQVVTMTARLGSTS